MNEPRLYELYFESNNYTSHEFVAADSEQEARDYLDRCEAQFRKRHSALMKQLGSDEQFTVIRKTATWMPYVSSVTETFLPDGKNRVPARTYEIQLALSHDIDAYNRKQVQL